MENKGYFFLVYLFSHLFTKVSLKLFNLDENNGVFIYTMTYISKTKKTLSVQNKTKHFHWTDLGLVFWLLSWNISGLLSYQRRSEALTIIII